MCLYSPQECEGFWDLLNFAFQSLSVARRNRSPYSTISSSKLRCGSYNLFYLSSYSWLLHSFSCIRYRKHLGSMSSILLIIAASYSLQCIVFSSECVTRSMSKTFIALKILLTAFSSKCSLYASILKELKFSILSKERILLSLRITKVLWTCFPCSRLHHQQLPSWLRGNFS